MGYSIEHYIDKGHSEEEAIILHENASNKVSLKNKIWAAKMKEKSPDYWSSRTETQLGYWINRGYNEEAAKEKLRKRQITFSLEKCIEKYGKEEGIIIFENRQRIWKSKVFNNETYIGGGRSKISEELFLKIIELMDLDDNIYLFSKNEKCIKNKNLGLTYKYDFCHLSKKKIIEFNGDFWHCNPELYESNYYHPVKNMHAKDIWEYDASKINLAESHGYNTLIVWERNYIQNPNNIIEKCINFLNC
jgi:very-short-patch-repair endonuclease